jgi:hypothetical protein
VCVCEREREREMYGEKFMIIKVFRFFVIVIIIFALKSRSATLTHGKTPRLEPTVVSGDVKQGHSSRGGGAGGRVADRSAGS